MKFRIVEWLVSWGHEAIHSSSLPEGNRPDDRDISTTADRDHRIVITKDSDFVDQHLLTGSPDRLLVIATGNQSNRELESNLKSLMPSIDEAFQASRFVEITSDGLFIRD